MSVCLYHNITLFVFGHSKRKIQKENPQGFFSEEGNTQNKESFLDVVVLQGHQEVDQGPPRDTERSRDIPILEASNRNGTAIKLACSPVLMLGRICGWISDLNS